MILRLRDAEPNKVKEVPTTKEVFNNPGFSLSTKRQKFLFMAAHAKAVLGTSYENPETKQMGVRELA